jgi:hypothetical protein
MSTPFKQILNSLLLVLCLLSNASCKASYADPSAKETEAIVSNQISPQSTYLAITFDWVDSNAIQIGDSFYSFRNNQLPYQFSENEYISDNYGGVTFTGYVDKIEHGIQYVGHLNEWQHSTIITMRDSTRVDTP